METPLYNETFQRSFLAYCLRDSDFLLRVVDDLDAKLFSNEILQKLVTLIKRYHQQYQAAPDTLAFRFLDSWQEKGLLHENVHKSMSVVLDELFTIPLQNRTFLLEQFNTFARQQLAKTYIIPFSDHIKKGEFEKAEELMKQLFQFRPGRTEELGRRLDPDPSARITRRRSEEYQRLWTLIPELDMSIDGLRPGELGVFVSQRTSTGKSAALQFLTRSAAFQGKKVLICTLEMSEQAYEDRLDQCIAGLTKDSLMDRDRINKALTAMTRFGGDIWIKGFSPGTPVSKMRKVADSIRNVHGWVPDVLVIDYLDEAGPETASLRGDLYAVGAEVYDTMNAWIQEEGLIGWTASQGRREAAEETITDVFNIAGSIAKANKAHLVLGLSRSAEQVKQNKTSIHVAKNREGKARFTVEINTDFDKMAFWVRPE